MIHRYWTGPDEPDVQPLDDQHLHPDGRRNRRAHADWCHHDWATSRRTH